MIAGMSGAARIDWEHGQVVGFALPEEPCSPYATVTLMLDGLPMTSAVAKQSVFSLGDAWGGLPVAPQEQCAFAMRIPQGRLLPSHLEEPQLTLSVQDGHGRFLMQEVLPGPLGVLALTAGAPLDLLYEVRFGEVRAGAVCGEVIDRQRLGLRPPLMARLNEGESMPMPWLDGRAEAGTHRFELPLPVANLHAGTNMLYVTSPEGHPLACYPIRLGAAFEGEGAQRLMVLEAEVQFLKRLLLTSPGEAAAAGQLDVFKVEMMSVCSEMLGLLRIHLEREMEARLRLALATGAPQPPAEPMP